jgi:hypothetical protein
VIAAGALVAGLAAPVAVSEASTLIDGKSIAIQSILGNRLKVNQVTGRQIKESTLQTVPPLGLSTPGHRPPPWRPSRWHVGSLAVQLARFGWAEVTASHCSDRRRLQG